MSKTPLNHPGDEALRALSLGQLTEAELAHFTAHLGDCPTCCRRIDQLVTNDPLLARLQQSATTPEEDPVMPAQRRLAVRALRQLHEAKSATRKLDAEAEPVIFPTPKQVGEYDILAEVGRGGMGVVYKARHRGLHRLAALKMVLAGEFASATQELRFRLEAELAARVQHPNIVQVYEIGTYEGRPFLAMEWVEGGSLANRLDGKPWPPGEAAALVETLARAIDVAHGEGIVHRDLKPANILLQKDEEGRIKEVGESSRFGFLLPPSSFHVPKITDFGLAQTIEGRQTMTQSGFLVGTPGYMAPEQASGNRALVGPPTDIYALGVVLYQLLTGQLPFRGDSTLELLRTVTSDEPTRPRRLQPRLPRDLEAITLHCLEKEPRRRYPSALVLAEDLRRFQEGEQVLARPVGAVARLGRACRRRPLITLLLALLAVSLFGGLGGVTWKWLEANEQRDRANAHAGRANAKNRELIDEQAKVQERFELAMMAIALFHTGVSEDMLLKNAEFNELRTKLLKEATGFYADLEKLLAGQTDAKSRKALAVAYFQLADLTEKIGDKKKALAVHLKALALRRELAAAEGADGETRLNVARSLEKVGWLLCQSGDGMLKMTGDYAGALAVFEEQRELAERLEAEDSTDAVLSSVASSHHNIAWVLYAMGRPEESLVSNRKALGIRQKLADANPADSRFQSDLATSHNHIGLVLWQTGKTEVALASWRKASAIWQKLSDANPADTQFQSGLAASHFNIGILLRETGKPKEALASWRKALAIQQKLADANPAVNRFQCDLALNHNHIGLVLMDTGKPEEALKYLEERLQQLKAKHGPDHPATLVGLDGVANAYLIVAVQQAWLGQEQEWAATCERGLALAWDTKIVTLADKVAKMCSLRPSNDEKCRAALLLAQRAVELGKDNQYLANFQMALGMAEYRSGHFAEADAALLAAMEPSKGDPPIAGTSAFYRALSLFRQGKPDEARQLATQAATKMKPLPKDAKNPLAGGGNHDTLILWLAYREAKDAIKFDEKSGTGSEPETQNKAKPKDGSP